MELKSLCDRTAFWTDTNEKNITFPTKLLQQLQHTILFYRLKTHIT